MTTYRSFEIVRQEWDSGYVAVHDAYDVDMDSDGTCTFSHPVIEQSTIAECKNEIDDWYAETGGEAWG